MKSENYPFWHLAVTPFFFVSFMFASSCDKLNAASGLLLASIPFDTAKISSILVDFRF